IHAVGGAQNGLEPLRAGTTNADAGGVGSAGGIVPDREATAAREPLESSIEEQCYPVADDRTAQRDAQLLARELLRSPPYRIPAGETLRLEVAGDRSFPTVGAGAGHGIDQPAGEHAVPNIEGRN